MRVVIVTGMSGAGKSTALKMLEDMEYFCVDNLPIPLLEKFAQLLKDGSSGDIQQVAVGVDIRSGKALGELEQVLERIRVPGFNPEILFLDADDRALVKRYKETRRSHPLSGKGDRKSTRLNSSHKPSRISYAVFAWIGRASCRERV